MKRNPLFFQVSSSNSSTGVNAIGVDGPEAGAEAAKSSAPAVTMRVPTSFRSRTDTGVSYGPSSTAEAAGATFYVSRKGEIDYHVLLKVSSARPSANYFRPVG
jgi:hypothetical protein